MSRIPATVIGLVVGLVWTAAQFGLSELCYRTAMALDASGADEVKSEVLYNVSEWVTWPASELYDTRYNDNIRAELENVAANIHDEQVRAEALQLLRQISTGEGNEDYDDPYEAADDFLFDMDIDTTPTMAQEYSIYAGVCVAWGVLVGAIAGLVVGLVRGGGSSRRDLPPVIHSLHYPR
jgi:type III secretory pathway component EscS